MQLRGVRKMNSDHTLENPALNKDYQGVLPLSCLPVTYRYVQFNRGEEIFDRTHFWVSIPDPKFTFELVKLDTHDPPEGLWGIALLQIVKLENGKVKTLDDDFELVFHLPFQPEMIELVDQWLVRLKTAVKEAMENGIHTV